MKRSSVSPACSGLLLSVVRAKDIDRTAVAAGRPATVAPWRRSAANVTGTLTADVRS